jgi:sigma-54 dependent transcriptional regulator, acetoin dehydrogenase operon transcriptional activator AcoR
MSGPHLFASTHENRVERAREQFFAQGLRPSGLVSEPVIQSWMRCLQRGRTATDAVAFEPVSKSRMHSTLRRHQGLLQAAESSIQQLEQALGGTGCRLLLTSGDGIVVHAGQPHGPQHLSRVLGVAARVGVDLSEAAVGTTAPGLVVAGGRALTVLGAEHYHQAVHGMSCAAAPIHDRHGALAGVLDLSIENQPFGFDAAALIGPYALAIENRLLLAQAHEELVLVLHADPMLLDTPLAGLLGIDGHGTVTWHNRIARRLVQAVVGEGAEGCIGLTVAQLHARSGCGTALLRLPNGLALWCRVQAPRAGQSAARELPGHLPPHAPVKADGSAPVAVPAEAPLSTTRRELIRQALAVHGGNIARTARALKVSRGLVYRALRGDA